MKTNLERARTVIAILLACAMTSPAPAAAQLARTAVRTAPVAMPAVGAAAPLAATGVTLNGPVLTVPTAPTLAAPTALTARPASAVTAAAVAAPALAAPAAALPNAARVEAATLPGATPAAKAFAVTAAPVTQALAGIPNAAKAAPGASFSAGVGIEDAMTGRRTAPGAGAVSVPNAPSAPRRTLLGAPKGAASAAKDESSDALAGEVKEVAGMISKLREEVARVIVGQGEMVDSIIMALIAREHVLLEGLPGVAKTTTVETFAAATGANSSTIQGTADKMPSDIIGSEVLETDQTTGKRSLRLIKGPVFAQFVLADEINRMMPKTQSALLQAMQSRKVSIGNETLPLPKPFVLLATMNPIEQEGVNVLPEAQLDRFMFKVVVPQPNREERKRINGLNRTSEKPKAEAVVTLEALEKATLLAEKVAMSEAVTEYTQDILDAAMDPSKVGIGQKGLVQGAVVTRASIMLEKAARIHAMMAGRTYVKPEDVQAVAPRILRHRIILSYAAGEMTTDALIAEILATVPVRR